MTTVVDGLVFDLAKTLLDRQPTFVRVAGNCCEEHLCATTSVTRDDAVAMTLRRDGDGYANKEWMFTRWLGEWLDVGLEMGSLKRW